MYKPILESPFTNELNSWPHLKDQKFVVQLLKNTILNKCKHLNESSVPISQWPWDILINYNEIVSYLSKTEPSCNVILFVCNKDQDIPSILLQQIPILSYISKTKVTLVQLPKGSLDLLRDAIRDKDIDNGLLLIQCNDKLDSTFLTQIESQMDTNEQASKFPWLDNLQYKPTNIKLLKSTIPLQSKIPKKSQTPHQK